MVGDIFDVARSLPGWKGLQWERGPALFSTGQEDGAQGSGKPAQGHRLLWQSKG